MRWLLATGSERTRRARTRRVGTLVCATLVLSGAAAWHFAPRQVGRAVGRLQSAPLDLGWTQPQARRVAAPDAIAGRIVAAARAQQGDGYDAAYRVIAYPGGDVPRGSGACTDVVVRALRGAGFDLQKLVHEDMTRHFARYPDPWKLGHTDANIDHRRVPNLMQFFARNGRSLPLGTEGDDLKSWLPGDIVCWKLEGRKWHTGVVSDGVSAAGVPLVVHNGWRCIEQDVLQRWPICGHFRFPRRARQGNP